MIDYAQLGLFFVIVFGVVLLPGLDMAFVLASALGGGRAAGLTFRRGMLTAMLNPKAYLFLLAIFPQFLHPQQGKLWLQALVLWIIIAAIQTSVYGSVALLGHGMRGSFLANPTAGAVMNRGVGTVLVLAAAFTAYDGWRRL